MTTLVDLVALRIPYNLLARVRLRNKSELLQNSQSTFLGNLANNLAILERKDGHSSKVNLLASVGLVKLAHRHVVKGTASVSAATNPLSCDIVALSNQWGLIRSESQIREGLVTMISFSVLDLHKVFL